MCWVHFSSCINTRDALMLIRFSWTFLCLIPCAIYETVYAATLMNKMTSTWMYFLIAIKSNHALWATIVMSGITLFRLNCIFNSVWGQPAWVWVAVNCAHNIQFLQAQNCEQFNSASTGTLVLPSFCAYSSLAPFYCIRHNSAWGVHCEKVAANINRAK